MKQELLCGRGDIGPAQSRHVTKDGHFWRKAHTRLVLARIMQVTEEEFLGRFG